ncbi:MAG: FAD-dependent oxidoreductase, partial [Candidatus Thermoplasmatota archaeon]|nr:FAD-dependent oxidoreductase [Candidatus Thermoplasmatota archaeon]
YSKCGLPYAVSGVIPKFDDLIEFSLEWFEKNRVKVMLETEVKKIDAAAKSVEIVGAGGASRLEYDSLIIATGANPALPRIEGAMAGNKLKQGVNFLRTIEDAKAVASGAKAGKKAVIIGAGLIGLEAAENLQHMGVEVTVVEYLKSLLPGMIDADMAEILQEQAQSKVKIMLNSAVTKILGGEKAEGVVVKDNETGAETQLPADIVIVATGNRAITELAASIGCEIGVTRQIKVNEKSETSVPSVYAVGDCTEFIDFVTGQPVPVGLGSVGVRQAIAAGINAAGGNMAAGKILATRTTHLFGLELAAAGPTQAALEKLGMKCIVGKFRGVSLPHYFPGGKPVNVKVICDETGKIIGAQVVGEGAALRTNTFAAAILKGMTVNELSMMETAYAPPVAPTLDPIVLGAEACKMRLRRR